MNNFKKLIVIISGIIDHNKRRLRSYVISRKAKNCGINLKVDSGCYFSALSNISFGDNVIINRDVIFQGNKESQIIIGNNCVISYRCQLLTGGRKIIDGNKILKEHIYKNIIIGNNVWVGANSVILPGITIGDNVIIGAGSVVTKSLEEGYIYAGNPARKIIKQRK